MDWQPIETYDKLKKKPKLAVFRFKPVDRGSHASLREAFQLDKLMGSRECTHWIELPEFNENPT